MPSKSKAELLFDFVNNFASEYFRACIFHEIVKDKEENSFYGPFLTIYGEFIVNPHTFKGNPYMEKVLGDVHNMISDRVNCLSAVNSAQALLANIPKTVSECKKNYDALRVLEEEYLS